MKVKLTYFRESGKFYSEGEYETTQNHLWMIWKEVKSMQVRRTLPDLIEGHGYYIVLIDVPDHTYNHPHLVV